MNTVETVRWTDVPIHSPLLTAEVGGAEVELDRETWESWTGRRWKNGREWHGPVYTLGTGAQWRGRRLCPCPKCQGTVDPKDRQN